LAGRGDRPERQRAPILARLDAAVGIAIRLDDQRVAAPSGQAAQAAVGIAAGGIDDEAQPVTARAKLVAAGPGISDLARGLAIRTEFAGWIVGLRPIALLAAAAGQQQESDEESECAHGASLPVPRPGCKSGMAWGLDVLAGIDSQPPQLTGEI
jgi:hypothetical protein